MPNVHKMKEENKYLAGTLIGGAIAGGLLAYLFCHENWFGVCPPCMARRPILTATLMPKSGGRDWSGYNYVTLQATGGTPGGSYSITATETVGIHTMTLDCSNVDTLCNANSTFEADGTLNKTSPPQVLIWCAFAGTCANGSGAKVITFTLYDNVTGVASLPVSVTEIGTQSIPNRPCGDCNLVPGMAPASAYHATYAISRQTWRS
jgi:hypothetical protein